MSEAKIKLPQGMCEAIGMSCPAKTEEQAVRDLAVLRVALRWQKENPPVPTLPQLRALETVAVHEPFGSTNWLSDALQEWVRRMYDEPETQTENPVDVIQDVLRLNYEDAERLFNAINRGQKAGPQ